MSQAGDISAVSGPVPPAVPTQFTTDSGIAIPAANNLNVFGGIGATTSGAGSTITITVTNDGYAWSEKNADFNIAVENAYFCNSLLTATLPDSAGLITGNSAIIYVDTTDTVTIQAGAGEFIQIGSNISVAGGTAASNTRGAILELVFKVSDLTWHTISSLGVWNVV